MMRKQAVLGAMLFMVGILTACEQHAPPSESATDGQGTHSNSTSHGDGDRELNPNLWPERQAVFDEVVEARVKSLLGGMSIEQKVGQLIQPEIKYITPEEARKHYIGSILNGGGTTPYNKRDASISEWVELAEAFYQASMTVDGDGPKIPIMWGSDAVHGHNNVLGAVLYPHNIGLGAANDDDLIYRIGVMTAEDVLVTGINWTFSPTVAVARDDRWGRTYESYSEDPEIVARYSEKIVEGTQKKPTENAKVRVIATAKHYLGDGGTTNGIDRGDTVVTEEDLVELHAPGFVTALDAGVLSVMASFSSWNSSKLHGDHYLLTTILKERMGFTGLVVGDWNAHAQVHGCTVESCPNAINAGVDIIMVPQDWKALYQNTLAQAKSGEISQDRLDDAVSRILRVKILSGLLDGPSPKGRALSGNESLIFAESRQTLAREAVRKSLVLLKNNSSALPLASNAKILVAGKSANDVGMQSGGWSISWQGTGTTKKDFPNATTTFEALKEALEANGGSAIFDEEGDHDGEVDAVVVVAGEYPYAEWHGDVPSLDFERGEKDTLALLEKVKQRGVPVITVFFSGRPMYTSPEINTSDAFVAAWLPGTEAAGIADVLIADSEGKPRYDFNGKLSFSWPRFPKQVVNRGDEAYSPLFAYGYGLSYSEGAQLDPIEIDVSQIEKSAQRESEWIFVSRVMRPWSLWVDEGQGDVTEVTGNFYASKSADAMKLVNVDKESQEDARQIEWPDKRRVSVYFASSKPQNLSHLSGDGGFVQFDIKTNQSGFDSTSISALCDEECELKTLSSLVPSMEFDKWKTLKIPLSCFPGAKGTNVSRALTLSGQQGVIQIANVRLLPESLPDGCNSTAR